MLNDVREDCYFFWADHDMGATIPNCTYQNNAYGECPCKGCQHILPKSKVREIVLNYISLHPEVLEADREAESRTPDAIHQLTEKISSINLDGLKEALSKSIVGGGRGNRA